MGKKFRNILFLLLSLIVLGGCKNNLQLVNDDEHFTINGYDISTIDIAETNYFSGVSSNNKNVLFYRSSSQEDGHNNEMFLTDLTLNSNKLLQHPTDNYLYKAELDDTSIWTLELANNAWIVRNLDFSGEEILKTDLLSYIGTDEPIYDFSVDDTQIALSLSDKVIVIDKDDWEIREEIKVAKAKIASAGSNEYRCAYQNDEGFWLYSSNGNTYSIEEAFYQIYESNQYDMLGTNVNGLYGIDFRDKSYWLIANWSQLGISAPQDVVEINSGDFLVLDSNGHPLLLNSRSTDYGENDKICELTFATYNINQTLKNAILEYNKISSNVTIIIKDYSIYDTDINIGMTKLNTEIISGDIPDIIDLNYLDEVNLSKKGLLRPINDFIDELPESEYLINVLESNSIDQSIYNFVPQFYLMTCLTSKAVPSNEAGWNLSEFISCMNEMGNISANIGSNYGRHDFLRLIIATSPQNFVDYTQLKCNFENESFENLLELLTNFPAVKAPAGSSHYQIYKGTQNVFFTHIDSLLHLQSLNAIFKNGFNIKGFPSDAKEAAMIFPVINLGISAQSPYYTQILDFYTYLLSYNYQRSIKNSFPVNINALHDKFEEDIQASREIYYLNFPDEYDQFTEVELKPLTDSDLNKLMNLLKSVNQTVHYDDKIFEIVIEEAEPYFFGDKDLDKVVPIIQNRVQILLDEKQ
ncbi:MAG: hypothetical protein GX025_02090 [Clostridiales bacterium]|nr:hypothetical protein [Clostridiales bacterium]